MRKGLEIRKKNFNKRISKEKADPQKTIILECGAYGCDDPERELMRMTFDGIDRMSPLWGDDGIWKSLKNINDEETK